MNRALVLSGGGSKGSFEVGVVRELEQSGVTFDFVCGTSVGAINGLLVAAGQTEKLEQEWRAIKGMSDVFSLSVLRFFGSWLNIPWSKPSIYGPGRLLTIVREMAETVKLEKPLKVGVTDLVSGQFKAVGHDEPNFPDYLIASASIPLVLPPVKIGGGVYVDGGIRNNTPLREAIRAGAEEIHLVMVNRREITRRESSYDGPFEIITRSFELMVGEWYTKDIKSCLEKNHQPGFRHIDLFIYEPEAELGSFLNFSPDNICQNIEKGRRVARQVLARK